MAPATAEYVPSSHGRHEEFPTAEYEGEYLPMSQGVQPPAASPPLALYVPAAHGRGSGHCDQCEN